MTPEADSIAEAEFSLEMNRGKLLAVREERQIGTAPTTGEICIAQGHGIPQGWDGKIAIRCRMEF